MVHRALGSDYRGTAAAHHRRGQLHGELWGAGLVDGRIVDLRIADHAHEEGALLGQRVLLLAVHDFGELVMLLLLQQFVGEVHDDVPGVVDVLGRGVLGNGAEADDVTVVHAGRHHVQLAGLVDDAKQLLVELVATLKPEADQAQLV